MLGVTCINGRGSRCHVLSHSHSAVSNRRAAHFIKFKAIKDDSNVKRAMLSANKKGKIKLPSYEDNYGGKLYHIGDFLNHPAGVKAILNADSLETYEALDSKTYRCRIPAIHFLNYDVVPVVDLLVNPTTEDCSVEMLSCKFEGSDIIKRQNEQFAASMTNHITWGDDDSESFLYVDVKLNIELKIHSLPFTLLPVSTVEGPGNIVMGALLERFVPLLLQQLLRDYRNWIRQQSGSSP